MTNLSMGMFIVIVCVLGIPVTVLSIVKRQSSALSSRFIWLCISALLWGGLNSVEYFANTDSTAIIFHKLKFVAIGMTGLFTFFVVMGVLRQKKLSRLGSTVLLSFPFCTLLVCLSDTILKTTLLFKNDYYILVNGVRVAQTQNGIWFYIHCFFSYVLMLWSAILLVRHVILMPPKYRASANIMLAGMGATFLTTVAAILKVLPYAFDAAPLVTVIFLTFYFIAAYYPRSIEALVSSREIVFEKAEYPMLILDHNENIIDNNMYALNLANSLGFTSLRGIPYHTFYDEWIMQSKAFVDKEMPSIFTINENSGDEHYQVIMNAIKDRTQKTTGTYVEIKNITPTMSLVHKLQEAAYFDQLTGLRNRNSFIQTADEYDREKCFPLGIVVGDVNNLKTVNDQYGHSPGDLMLQRIANILCAVKPKGSLVFRTGGDEFVLLAPGVSKNEMEKFIADVYAKCKEAPAGDKEVPLSIALGYCMKEKAEDSVHYITDKADKEMYINKNNRRER